MLSSPLYAALQIDITQGAEGALPIAVVPFGSQGQVSTQIADIIQNDLKLSGRFSVLSNRQLPAQPHNASDINYEQWRSTGAHNLVVGKVTQVGKDAYEVIFYLVDIFSGEQLMAFRFPPTATDLRRTAHLISDKIYQALTGERGAFSTRIAYITQQGKRYQLHIADIDGANGQTIVTSTEPLLSPAWSPNGERLAYVSLERKRTTVYIQDLRSGKRQQAAAWPGLNTAPSWSPDGHKLALSLSKSGNPEIYILDLRSRNLQQLTHSRAIDTEPVWSPDGQTLVFTSDRGGQAQLYQISAQGGTARRLTFEGRYNAKADFSPDGKQLVFLHNSGNSYQIAVMTLANRQLQILSHTSLDESPSFAPNGSMIMYAAGHGLAAVSVDGGVRQQLSINAGVKVREPAWSPFLQ